MAIGIYKYFELRTLDIRVYILIHLNHSTTSSYKSKFVNIFFRIEAQPLNLKCARFGSLNFYPQFRTVSILNLTVSILYLTISILNFYPHVIIQMQEQSYFPEYQMFFRIYL